MRRLLRRAGWFLAVTTGLWAIGQVVARRIEGSVDQSDAVFRLAAVWGGRQFASSANPLLSGAVVAVFGGVDLDLTGATPSPEGARLSLKAVMAGIHVVVPTDWRVEVVGELQGGDVHTAVADVAGLPDEAPSLIIDVSGRAAGIAVESARPE